MNGGTHRLVAGASIALYIARNEEKLGKQTANPVLGGLLASVLTNVPDWIEPATHPGHRSTAHSLVVAGLLGIGLYELHQWQPDNELGRFIRGIGKVAIAAYLIQLALDSLTAKSLPFVGRG